MSDVDNHNRGVLHMAVEGEFPNVVAVLLDNGADPDQMDEEGNTGQYGMNMYIIIIYPTYRTAHI